MIRNNLIWVLKLSGKYLFLTIIFFVVSLRLYSQKLELYSKNDSKDDYILEEVKAFENNQQLIKHLETYQLKDYSNGFISSGYDSIINDTVTKTEKAYYTRGLQYRWNNIAIKGIDDNNKKVFLKSFSQSKIAAIDKLQGTFQSILDNMAANGYPFASIKMDSIQILDDGKIDGTILVESGKLYRFDSIIVKGDAKIKQYYVEKYVGIKKGDIFSISKANDISRKIKNLAFLEESRAFELAFADSIADILIYLRNRKANQFTGLIGILPNSTTTGKVLITGDINLYLLNSIGFGELFSFKWQKFETLSQNLNIDFSFPYLFKTDFGVAAQFNIEKKDSSYVNTDFMGKILFGSNVGTGFDVYYRNTSSFLLGKTSESVASNFSENSVNLFGISYRFSNLNNIFNPRSGIMLNITSAFGTKVYENIESEEAYKEKPIFQNRSKLDISGFIPVGRAMAIKLRNQTSVIYSRIIFNNELDLIGGLNTIRGFDELTIPVSSYSIVNLEYRYLFEEASGVFAFFDVGYFEKRFTNDDSFNYGMGLGVGLDLKTPAGIFSLVYAIGKQNENQFQFNNSKIHFGYKNYF